MSNHTQPAFATKLAAAHAPAPGPTTAHDGARASDTDREIHPTDVIDVTSAPRVYFSTYGCQMNFLDSELAMDKLRKRGYLATPSMDDADVILFNTCAVRDHAEQKVLSHVGRLKPEMRHRPGLIVGVMGCQAQRDGENLLQKLPHVRLVVGTRAFPRLPEFIAELREDPRRRILALDMAEPVSFDRDITNRPDRHKAYLAIMRGCDHTCSYCIVPSTRGREQYRKPFDILEDGKRLVDDGVSEITLLGQNVNSYGRKTDFRHHDLLELLDRELHPRGLRRLLFITNHPRDLDTRVLDVMRDGPSLCPYLHLPVQSGSDRVLRAMKRGYTRERYLSVMAEARARVPEIGIATDFIVGFPTESDAEFEESLSLQDDVRFQGAFVFKYSPRPGTKSADEMEDDVPDAVKKERNQRMLARQRAHQLELNRARIGQIHEVFGDGPSKHDPTKQVGRTRQHQIVAWADTQDRTGQYLQLRITNCTDLTLFAEPV